MGTGFLFGMMEHSGVSGDGSIPWIYKTHWTAHSKWAKLMVCEIYLNKVVFFLKKGHMGNILGGIIWSHKTLQLTQMSII